MNFSNSQETFHKTLLTICGKVYYLEMPSKTENLPILYITVDDLITDSLKVLNN